MNSRCSVAVVVTGLVLMVAGAASWGGQPPDPTDSDPQGNTAGGSGALFANTIGHDNTAFGAGALRHNTEDNTAGGGNANTASGFRVLFLNTTGSNNTASGFQALFNNTTGSNNTAGGVEALRHNTEGSDNTASGFQALFHNTMGNDNTASGESALFHNTKGNNNTASGFQALYSNTKGSSNIAFGRDALFLNTKGDENIAIGTGALQQNTGRSNIAVGFSAGSNLTNGDFNIYLGGFPGAAGESNTMRLGNSQTTRPITGIAGTLITGGASVLMDLNGQLGTQASSARYKRDIHAMGARSRQLLQLRPVTFHYKQDPHGPRQYGLIAEEVAKVYPELVVWGAKGEVESVQYHELIPMLLNEVQHQQQALAELKAQTESLGAALAQQQARSEEQQTQNVALAARLQRLEEGAVRATTLVSR